MKIQTDGLVLLCGLLFAVGCYSTEVVEDADEFIGNFASSSCGGTLEQTATGIHGRGEFNIDEYRNLSCVHWKANESGNLELTFIGFITLCESLMAGNVYSWSDVLATLQIYILPADCMCCYEFGFEIPGEQRDLTQDFGYCVDQIFIFDEYDPSEGWGKVDPPPCLDPVILHTSKGSEGIQCEYPLEAGSIMGPCVGNDTGLHRPCNPGSCEKGHICEPVSDQLSLCMQPCETDEDCPLDVLSCQDGLCKLE